MPKCLRVVRHSERKRRAEGVNYDGESSPKRYCQSFSEPPASETPSTSDHHVSLQSDNAHNYLLAPGDFFHNSGQGKSEETPVEAKSSAEDLTERFLQTSIDVKHSDTSVERITSEEEHRCTNLDNIPWRDTSERRTFHDSVLLPKPHRDNTHFHNHFQEHAESKITLAKTHDQIKCSRDIITQVTHSHQNVQEQNCNNYHPYWYRNLTHPPWFSDELSDAASLDRRTESKDTGHEMCQTDLDTNTTRESGQFWETRWRTRAGHRPDAFSPGIVPPAPTERRDRNQQDHPHSSDGAWRRGGAWKEPLHGDCSGKEVNIATMSKSGTFTERSSHELEIKKSPLEMAVPHQEDGPPGVNTDRNVHHSYSQLTSLPASVIRRSGSGIEVHPNTNGSIVTYPEEKVPKHRVSNQSSSFITITKDCIKLPRELFLDKPKQQVNVQEHQTVSVYRPDCRDHMSSAEVNPSFLQQKWQDKRNTDVRFSCLRDKCDVPKTNFVTKEDICRSRHEQHSHVVQSNIDFHRQLPVHCPSSVMCLNRGAESCSTSSVAALKMETPSFQKLPVMESTERTKVSLSLNPSPCQSSLKQLAPPLTSPVTSVSRVSYVPAHFPQHADYSTGIPQNLSPPPALSVGFKYGMTPSSLPLTPPRLLRPTPLVGFGVTYCDRDDDTHSTSSASSSLSSGSTLSPRRPERMTSHTDMRHGYSTSTPSPMTSPSSHGQLSPVSPGMTSVEMVNGGYGFKNPILTQASPSSPHSEQPPCTGAEVMSQEGGEFRCQVCEKRFRVQRLLTRHLKCHSEVKRFLCSICHKGFNDTFDLKRHTRTHTGVKPFKCHCGKAFTQRCSLESHERKVHGQMLPFAYKERRSKLYVCEDCGSTSHDPALHFLHIQRRHPHSPVLLKFYDKRQFKFSDSSLTKMLCAPAGGSAALVAGGGGMRPGLRKS